MQKMGRSFPVASPLDPHSVVLRRDALLAALFPVVFYHPLLRLNAMQSGGDAANLFWPVKFLLAESFLQHQIVPLWNPWSFMGAPLLASLQHAVLYPPDWLLYGCLPPHIAMAVGSILHLMLAAVGTWVWLRVALRCGRIPAVVLGGAFPCVAWFWGHQEHINQVAATSYIPLQSAVAWLFLSGRIDGRGFALWYGGLAALQFLTGHPQEAFYGHFFVAILGAWAALRNLGSVAWWGRTIAGALLAAVFAGLLVAVQLLPTLELNGHSRRQFRDPLYAISFSMPPDVLLSHFNPHREGSFRDGYFVTDPSGAPVLDEAGNPAWNRRAFGEYGVFVGIPVLLLGAVALFHAQRRRPAIGLLCLYLLVTALALGGNTDPQRLATLSFTEFPEPGNSLHELFLRAFPPAQGFRVPARIMVLGSFALITLAAFGLELILRHQPTAARRRLVGLLMALAVFGALYLPSRREKFHFPATIEEPLLLLGQLQRLEPSLDGRLHRLMMSDDDSLIRERHLETTFSRQNPIAWRFSSLQPHLNVPVRVPLIDGYEEGLVPTARFKDFQHAFNRNFRQFHPDIELLALLGVSHIASELPVDSGAYPLDPSASLPAVPAFRNPLAKGSAFLVDGTENIDFSKLDGPFWQGGEPLPGFSTQQVEFGRLNRNAWMAAPRLRTEVPNVNTLEVSGASGEGLIAMGWYPGWVVVGADSARSPLEFISAVHGRLPAALNHGEGQAGGWSLRFEPRSYAVGLFLSALGFALLGFLMGSKRR